MITVHLCALLLTICATIHLVLACVLALYARHKVEYLALTWIMGIFGFAIALVVVSPINEILVIGTPGIFHPLLLLSLTAVCYLQSIYPLSVPMPAYLQWGRMWSYAFPIVILYSLYILFWLFGMETKHIETYHDFFAPPYSIDVLFRIAAIGLGVYYVANLFRLPKHLAHQTNVPRFVKGYSSALGLSVILYLVVTVYYSPLLIVIYTGVFTLLNAYLVFRTLETMAVNLPKPVIEKVVEEPTAEQIEKAEQEDFNEANRQYFLRIEYWMQNHREKWTQSSFNRDQLCNETGLNRHILLQCVRSQGYNDTHEYLNAYRVEELKRLIKRGKIGSVSESADAGFGTPKTARTVFQKIEGVSLDDYIASHRGVVNVLGE